MGHGRPSHRRRSRALDGETAVTPVIGAILILAITILGIGGVLFWGAPVIERIQAQNAQTAVVGEFEELRDSSRDLSVPDHSRFPTIVVPRGELALQPGSRFLVTADRDSGQTNCDFHVTNWADTASKTTFSVSAPNCRTPSIVASAPAGGATARLEVYTVSGGTLVAKTITAAGACAATCYTVSGTEDLSTGDWLFRLTNTACPGSICAEAWLLSTDQIAWTMESSSGKRTVSFDNGAIFSDSGGSLFLESEASIGDSVFGSQYYGLWLRSLVASSYTGISGAGSHQVYLSLLGNYDRADSPGVYRLRFDSAGTLAQGWCNAFLLRNAALTTSSYRSDTTTPCSTTSGDTAGTRSVCYAMLPSASNSCTTAPTTPFTFRFLHARIYTSLAA